MSSTPLRGAITALRGEGVSVHEHARPNFRLGDAFRVYQQLLYATLCHGLPLAGSPFMSHLAPFAAFVPGDSQLARAARGGSSRHAQWIIANEVRQEFRNAWEEFFHNYDALLCPATPCVAIPHNDRFGDMMVSASWMAHASSPVHGSTCLARDGGNGVSPIDSGTHRLHTRGGACGSPDCWAVPRGSDHYRHRPKAPAHCWGLHGAPGLSMTHLGRDLASGYSELRVTNDMDSTHAEWMAVGLGGDRRPESTALELTRFPADRLLSHRGRFEVGW